MYSAIRCLVIRIGEQHVSFYTPFIKPTYDCDCDCDCNCDCGYNYDNDYYYYDYYYYYYYS
eukprot:14282115-Heterocapsa_arctica.AAC.1